MLTSVVEVVDTGSQSTIISRAMIVQHLRSRGQSLPVLETPTVRLFGKDGRGGGWDLIITAHVWRQMVSVLQYLFLYSLRVNSSAC